MTPFTFMTLLSFYNQMKIIIFIIATIAIRAVQIEKFEPIKLYRNTAQIQVNVSSITQQYQNVKQLSCENDQNIKYLTLGNSSSDLGVILSCNVHAHEIISTQLCIDFMNEILAQNHSILAQMKFTIFYLANTQRSTIFQGNFCKRTDQNNIDQNRNFPFGFEVLDKKLQTYGGKTPLTEPFTICLDKMLNETRPKAYLDIHTGQFNLYYFKFINDSNDQDASLDILKKVQVNNCKNCRITNVYDLNILGQGFEYAKYHYNVTYSNLIQIYGGYNINQQTNELCFTIFNPLTSNQLQYYLDKWTKALIYYYQQIINAQKSKKTT